jgi:hypothetical protein
MKSSLQKSREIPAFLLLVQACQPVTAPLLADEVNAANFASTPRV